MESTMTDHTTAEPGPGRIDALMTVEEVAELLRMPVATVRYWRVLDTGPRGFILGRRLRYFRKDVLDWLEERRESARRGVA
jgi:DNA-binding transcriptional MerR regulator